MDCRDFQKKINDVINHQIPFEEMQEMTEHVCSCKECKDELEMNYVLKYGFSDDDFSNVNIIGVMENDIQKMTRMARYFYIIKSFYVLICLTATVSVLGCMIYCAFKVWF